MGWFGFALALSCIVFSVWRLATLRSDSPNRDLWLNVSITLLIIGVLIMLIQIFKYASQATIPTEPAVENAVLE